MSAHAGWSTIQLGSLVAHFFRLFPSTAPPLGCSRLWKRFAIDWWLQYVGLKIARFHWRLAFSGRLIWNFPGNCNASPAHVAHFFGPFPQLIRWLCRLLCIHNEVSSEAGRGGEISVSKTNFYSFWGLQPCLFE